MTILSYEITSDEISLSTYEEVDELILTWDTKLASSYTLTSVGETEITITASDLGLDDLDNLYFKLEVIDTDGESAYQGLYYVDLENDLERYDYDATDLKNELDTLNYYDSIIESLTAKEAFFEASDMFINFINFLETKLYGNNFDDIVNG